MTRSMATERAGAGGSGAADGTGAGPRPGRSRRGSTGCSAAGATPPSTRPAEYAEAPDRLHRVARARRLVLAAPRAARARSRAGRAGSARWRSRRAARSRASRLAQRPADELGRARARMPVEALALGELARLGPRDDDDVVVGRARARPRAANASRSRRLTRLRSTAPPTLRDTDSPRRGPSRRGVAVARERVEDEEAVADASGPGGRPARTRRCATDGRAWRGRARHRARGRVHRQTVSRLRPLARRRLSVRRPARVRMRARNPWARARLRFLGW